MAKLKLPKGTKEYIVIGLEDRLGTITTLTGAGMIYDIFDAAGNAKYNDAPGANMLMKAMCMCDTNLGGLWAIGRYELFIQFNALPEVPRLGPFPFLVV